MPAYSFAILDWGDEINLTLEDKNTELRNELIENLNLQRKALELSQREISKDTKIKQEKIIIEDSLKANGYYDFKIKGELKDNKIYYHVDAGEVYKIAKVDLVSNLDGLPTIKELGLSVGNKFKAQDVLDSIKKLDNIIEENKCLWKINVSYEALVIHRNQKAELVLKVENSEEVKFGEVSFTGLKTIKEKYLDRKITFKNNECFKRKKIEQTKLNLFETGLISTVDIKLTKDNGLVNVIFNVTEKKNKTIETGIGLKSDEGGIFSVGWEHRNLFGSAEKLKIGSRVSNFEQNIEASYNIPNFYRANQNLIIDAELAKEDLDSYDSRSLTLSAKVEREISKQLTVNSGTQFKYSRVDDSGSTDTYGLISLPNELNYDTRNDILNPIKGYSLTLALSPYFDLFDKSTSFFKTQLGAKYYYKIYKSDLSPIIAGKFSTGSIWGQKTLDIPADERFYSGGSGSVRGYEYQKLGELDANADPIGGRSYIDLSLETRLKFTENWGGVVFLDGGNSFDSNVADFSKDLRFAYGFGARYYTSFAPIRFDIAFPMNKRDGIDSSYQFYISIGQAF